MGRRREDGCRTGKKKCARVRGIRLPALQGGCVQGPISSRGEDLIPSRHSPDSPDIRFDQIGGRSLFFAPPRPATTAGANG